MSQKKNGLNRPALAQLSTALFGRTSGESDKDARASDEGCFGEALFGGHAPARSLLFGDATSPWRAEKFGLQDNNPANWAGIQTNLKREVPLLQDPAETFERMNKVMHQTLKYVKEVESIDFSSREVTDFNGKVMEDPRRVFLSVCASVLANFSFIGQMDVEKLLSFLSALFESYATDNAYHNALHAADSVQMLFIILREKPAKLIFTDDEIIVAFLATLSLSFVHPGVSNAFLARIDHPLVWVYGDITTQQSASLTAFLYHLNREENRFIDLFANSGTQPFSQFLRELLFETVLNTAPRLRGSLLRGLEKLAAAKAVELNDVPLLLSAVIILADNALVLRPHAQFVALAGRMVTEWLREAYEEEQRSMEPLVPNLRGQVSENGLGLVVDYCKAWLVPVITAVRALVPQDLYDNMVGNTEAATSMSEAAEFEGQLTPCNERWNDGSVPVIDIIRRVTMHATSLDRKASKRAILNAASSRGVSSFLSPSSSLCSPPGEARAFPDPAERRANPHTSRCEHYFSFLRLYDTYEKEGRPASEFAAQLVFLALQLNHEYIGSYTHKGVEVCSKKECEEIAKLIMEKEEAPTTAEVIASPLRDGQQTDGFILRLMEMYAEREREKGRNETPASNPTTGVRRALNCSNPVYGGMYSGKKS
ncbi:cAMP-specific phosphodiesterase [Trypanosoma conorhini]|uniref:cAMP-specific phosphodiesterase n=1 Tax=Trypanosoma conorhini TaxID=83891 RepID=A0A3R7M7L8_9TRYP|nr:cAMP-specific phosphodiesterase [Trypanosoma conorhini]RNE97633.1 cAMP-specific phosphodiesterase [Trypanosoma conorhini]